MFYVEAESLDMSAKEVNNGDILLWEVFFF